MDFSSFLREGERLDDLQREHLRIIQDPKGFCFGMDSVLLADFVSARHDHVLVDLGTGTGILPLLTWARYHYAHMDALEIQPDCADRARRSIALNQLQDQITVVTGDLKYIRTLLPHAAYDAVVCNPPYTRNESALPARIEQKHIARQESECTLEDIAAAAAWLLRNHGHFFVMLPAFRFPELTQILSSRRMQPKRVRFIHSRIDSPARIVLVDAMYNAKPGTEFLPPLITHTASGEVTDEVKRIYGVTDGKE